jgi:hypothetical protein
MNGLRLYTNVDVVQLNSPGVYFSRRGNGPYYRWRYEAVVDQWNVSRVIAPDFSPHSLTVAAWKNVPRGLQARLAQHYME